MGFELLKNTGFNATVKMVPLHYVECNIILLHIIICLLCIEEHGNNV